MPDSLRPHSMTAVPLPNSMRTEVRSPRKTTPVRRLTVNRKPLRTHGSLAQPPTSGNELYSTSGHLLALHRLPHDSCTPRHNLSGPPCLTTPTVFSLSRRIPSNT